MAGKHTRKAGRRRGARVSAPYAWLGAGVVGAGVGAALVCGAGVAYADEGASSEGSSASRSIGTADSDTADGKISAGPSRKNERAVDSKSSNSSRHLSPGSVTAQDSDATSADLLDRQNDQDPASGHGLAGVDQEETDTSSEIVGEEETPEPASVVGEAAPTLPIAEIAGIESKTITPPTQTFSADAPTPSSMPNEVSEADLTAPLAKSGIALAAATPAGPTINQVLFSTAAFDFFQPSIDWDPGEGTWTPVLFDHLGHPYAHELTGAPDATNAVGNVGPAELATYVYYIVAFAADPADIKPGYILFDTYHAVAAKELVLGDRSYLVENDQTTHLNYLSLVFLWKKTGIPAAVKALPRALPAPKPTPPTPPEPDTIAPTAPVVASSTITPTSVKLTPSEGTDNVGVVGYNIYRDGNRVKVNDALIPVGGFIIDFGLDPDSVHFYYARAVDAAGNESVDSRSLRVNTLDAPSEDPDSEWEKNWEIFNDVYGWIPIFGQGLSIVSFAIDSIQLAAALGSGDRAAIIDEIRDLTGSAVGVFPFGRLVSEPIEDLINILATLILGATENAAVPETQALTRSSALVTPNSKKTVIDLGDPSSATSFAGTYDRTSYEGQGDKCVGLFLADCGSHTSA